MGRKPDPEVRQKRARILELFRANIDPEVIAEETGYKNGATVRAIYWEEITSRRDKAANECRTQQLDRVDAMMAGAWPKARKGDEKAIQSVLKLMEREAKLLGLDYSDHVAGEMLNVMKERGQQLGMFVAAVLNDPDLGLTDVQKQAAKLVLTRHTQKAIGAA